MPSQQTISIPPHVPEERETQRKVLSDRGVEREKKKAVVCGPLVLFCGHRLLVCWACAIIAVYHHPCSFLKPIDSSLLLLALLILTTISPTEEEHLAPSMLPRSVITSLPFFFFFSCFVLYIVLFLLLGDFFLHVFFKFEFGSRQRLYVKNSEFG